MKSLIVCLAKASGTKDAWANWGFGQSGLGPDHGPSVEQNQLKEGGDPLFFYFCNGLELRGMD